MSRPPIRSGDVPALVRHYMLGKLHFTISGDHPVAMHVAEEFVPLAVSAPPGRGQLRFNFVNDLSTMSGASHVGGLRILDDRFAIERGGMSYQAVACEGGVDVSIVPVPLGAAHRVAPEALARCADWNHLTRFETTAKNFVYDLFDYMTQIVQLPLGQSHLHASSFEKNGRGVAIIAWGGVGKTTAMLKLVLEDGWRYLSDDLVTIDCEGMLWRSPKRLQIYAYNVENQDRIRDMLMSGRDIVDRSLWTLRRAVRGPNKVRRRVSAEQLFGSDSTTPQARLATAIYIERVDEAEFSASELTAGQLADRAAATVMSEIQPFVELSMAMHSGERRPILPDIESMHAGTRRVLAQAFAGIRPIAVRIPLHAGPDAISDYLRPLLVHGAAVSAVVG
jgi:serine kinase of HPr protein (carbohydrate metabolism regulator)